MKLISIASVFLGISISITKEELFKKLIEAHQNIATAHIRYLQRINFLGEEYFLRGDLKFKKPDKLLIKLSNPQDEFILIDGNSASIYSPAKNQLLMSSKSKMMKRYPELSLLFMDEEEMDALWKKYWISCTEKKNFFQINLKKGGRRDAKKILIKFDKSNLFPIYLKINFQDYKSEIFIKQYVINKKLPPSIFKFKLPDDVRRINLK